MKGNHVVLCFFAALFCYKQNGVRADCGSNLSFGSLSSVFVNNTCRQFSLTFDATISGPKMFFMENGDLLNDICTLYDGTSASGSVLRSFTGDGKSSGFNRVTGNRFLECVLTQDRTGTPVGFSLQPVTPACNQIFTGFPVQAEKPATAARPKDICSWVVNLPSPTNNFIHRLVFRPMFLVPGARVFIQDDDTVKHFEGGYDDFNFEMHFNNSFEIFLISPYTTARVAFKVTDGPVESCGNLAAFDIDGKLIIDNTCLSIKVRVSRGGSLLLYHKSGDIEENTCWTHQGGANFTTFTGISGEVHPVPGDGGVLLSCSFRQPRSGEPVIFQVETQTPGCRQNLVFSDFPATVQDGGNSTQDYVCVWTGTSISMGAADVRVTAQPITLSPGALLSIKPNQPDEPTIHWKGPTSFNLTVTELMQTTSFSIYYINSATSERFSALLGIIPPERICSIAGIELPLFNEDLISLNATSGDHLYISTHSVENLDELDPECRSTVDDAFFKFNITKCPAIRNPGGSDVIEMTYTIWNQKQLDLSDPVQRYIRYALNITCMFNATVELTSVNILPQINEVITALNPVSGEFEMSLQLYDSDAFSSALPADASVAVPDFLYGKVALDQVTDGEFIIELETCWATQTLDPNTEPSYPIISGHCADTSGDEPTGTREVLRNFQADNSTFRFQTFVWTNVSDVEQMIFVHCYSTICQNSTGACVDPGCMRKRRSVNPDHHRQLTFGPIKIVQAEKCYNGMCSDVCEIVEGKAECSCFEGRKLTRGGKMCTDVEKETTHNINFTFTLLAVGFLVLTVGVILHFIRKKPSAYNVI